VQEGGGGAGEDGGLFPRVLERKTERHTEAGEKREKKRAYVYTLYMLVCICVRVCMCACVRIRVSVRECVCARGFMSHMCMHPCTFVLRNGTLLGLRAVDYMNSRVHILT